MGRGLGWSTLTFLGLCALQSPAISLSAVAQGLDENCWTGAIMEHRLFSSDDRLYLAMLNEITAENFSDRKKSYGGGLDIEGFSLSGDYGDFDSARRKEFQRSSFSENRESSVSYIEQAVSSKGLEAVQRCMELKSRSVAGIHMWVQKLTARNALVAMYWQPPPLGSQRVTVAVATWEGTTTGRQVVPRSLGLNETRSFSIARSPTAEVLIAVNVSGYTSHVSIPPTPPSPMPQWIASEYGKSVLLGSKSSCANCTYRICYLDGDDTEVLIDNTNSPSGPFPRLPRGSCGTFLIESGGRISVELAHPGAGRAVGTMVRRQ
jgi:hypothetical protein